MRPIPKKLRNELAGDPWMTVCCYPGCISQQVEWHHALRYNSAQINEAWAIVPLCHEHHYSQEAKIWAELLAITRMSPEAKARYPRKNWNQRANELFFKLTNN